MKIVADNTIPYLKGVLEPYANVIYLNSNEFSPANIKDAEILIVRSIDKCSAQLLAGSHVKLITTATIGYDHIDTDYCERAGIEWHNAPGCNSRSVAEYILNSLFSVSLKKKIDLKNKTIGIVGVGHVGEKVAQLAGVYGMKVLLNDPPRAEKEGSGKFVSLQTIAEEANIITFHTPLTKTGNYPTWHLADSSFFSLLQKKPWFINASRGAVHDTKALIEAKQKGLISEIILDCWEKEPDIDHQLLELTSIATPHIAGFSADGKANATRMCVEQISSYSGIDIPTDKIKPLPPANSVIDFVRFRSIELAALGCFNPMEINSRLKQKPEKFEYFRNHYNHPREFNAYTIVNASPEEMIQAEKLGFHTGL